MGIFLTLGYGITKCPVLCALLLPITSIVFVSVGFQNYKVADDVSSIWVPETTTYAADSKYKESIVGGSASTSLLAISRPRQGGNVMTAELLLEMRDRLNETQSTTVSVDGMTFGLHDVCANPGGPYIFPCLRMTVLDCFAEGGYDFTQESTQAWQVLAKGMAKEALRPLALVKAEAQAAAAKPAAMQAGLDYALASVYESVVHTALAQSQTGPCAGSCTVDGLADALAIALGQPAGTWENDPVCTTCLQTAASNMTTAEKDMLYAKSLEQLTIPLGVSITKLQTTYNVTDQKEALDMFIRALPQVVSMVEVQVDAEIKAHLDATFEPLLDAQVDEALSGQTPYTFKTFPPMGTNRQYLKDPNTGQLATDAEVLAAASGTCYAWDGGAVLPANLDVLLYGKPIPVKREVLQNLTSIEALHHIYSLMVPLEIQSRVAGRPVSHGGPVNITQVQAEEVLAKFKRALEESFSAGWDDDSQGNLEHTAFTDDGGADGTFARTLSEVTTDSMPLIALYGALIVILSALFFITTDGVASRVGLVTLGSILALLGCFAALGLTAMTGIDLNVVHFWIMPFIIVGIGIDDMFMLTLSTETLKLNDGSIQDCFAEAFAKVALPITMTSLVNAAMFAIMSFASDIPAVYQAGYTGLMATVILYLTMLLSFSGLVFLDSKRRAARRYECLPCRVAGAVDTSSKPGLGHLVYEHAYKPLISRWPLRLLVLLVAVAVLLIASLSLHDLPVGLDLDDFFPVGSQAGKFTENRKTYFPVWPVTLNWGAIDYTNPDVQLKMAQQWERMLDTEYIAGSGLQTTMVWTAALAEWGMSNNGTCVSTFRNNTLGLKLKSVGGFCLPTADGSHCPVLEGLTQEQFVKCVAKWKSSSFQYQVIAPRIPMSADGNTPIAPIRYSSASGSVLFATNLWKTTDYTKMIEQTRLYADDDASFQSWMSGTPYDFWEQYLTIVEVLLLVGGLSIAIGFVISIIFLLLGLVNSKRGTCMQRLCICCVTSFSISLVSAVSLTVVVGFCALMDIKLSGFTAMSCVTSTGLAVEYSVHVVHRFLESDRVSAADRVNHAMSWLFSPGTMAFLTSAFSVLMMAFSEFRFVRLYFFAPLACAVLTSYFFGVFALPCLLGFMDCLPVMMVAADDDDQKTNEGNGNEQTTNNLSMTSVQEELSRTAV